jgi:hypothetical protein
MSEERPKKFVTQVDPRTMTEVPATIEGVCERCGKRGLVGDFPGQGGVVADAHGHLICDDCAED